MAAGTAASCGLSATSWHQASSKMVERGNPINKAVAAFGVNHKRVRLIARKNSFRFADTP